MRLCRWFKSRSRFALKNAWFVYKCDLGAVKVGPNKARYTHVLLFILFLDETFHMFCRNILDETFHLAVRWTTFGSSASMFFFCCAASSNKVQVLSSFALEVICDAFLQVYLHCILENKRPFLFSNHISEKTNLF